MPRCISGDTNHTNILKLTTYYFFLHFSISIGLLSFRMMRVAGSCLRHNSSHASLNILWLSVCTTGEVTLFITMQPSSVRTVSTRAMISLRCPPCPPMKTASGRGRVSMSAFRKSPMWTSIPGAPKRRLFSCISASHSGRSLEYNFEVNAFMYDRPSALACKAMFQHDMECATLLTLEEWNTRPWYQRLLESILRLFSPLL